MYRIIVDGIQKAYNYRNGFQIFNLGYGSQVSVLDFLKVLEKLTGYKAETEYVGNQPGDVNITSADSSKAESLLDFKLQVDIKKGLELYFNWYQSYYKLSS